MPSSTKPYCFRVTSTSFKVRPLVVCFLLFFFIGGNCFAQVFRQYTTAHGLAANALHEVFQDSEGIIWVGSERGVSSFDGNSFRSYGQEGGLAGQMIINISEDLKGDVWFGSVVNNLFRFVRAHDSIVPFIKNDEMRSQFTVPFEQISFSKDAMHLSGKFIGSPFITITDYYSETPKIPDVSTPKSPSFYVRNIDSLPFVFNYKPMARGNEEPLKFHMITDRGSDSILLPSIHRAGVSACLLSDQDAIAVLSRNKLNIIQTSGAQTELSLGFVSTTELLNDANGYLWIGSFHDGIFRYKSDDLTLPPTHFLPGVTVTGIIEDRNGGIWVSTLEAGLYYAANPGIESITTPEGEVIDAKALRSSGNLLALTNDFHTVRFGAYEQGRSWSPHERAFKNPVLSFDFIGPDLLVDLRNQKLIRRVASNHVRTFTDDSISIVRVRDDTAYLIKNAGRLADSLFIHDPNGSLLRAFEIQGITRLRDMFLTSTSSFYAVDRTNHLHYVQVNEGPVLQSQMVEGWNEGFEVVNVVAWHGSTYLFSNIGRCYRLEGHRLIEQLELKGGSFESLHQVTRISGSRELLALVSDQGIFLWESPNKRMRTIPVASIGLGNQQIYEIALVDERILAATSLGVVSFDTAGLVPNVDVPRVEILEMSIDGLQKLGGVSGSLEATTGLKTLEIRFRSIQYQNALEIPYRYRLYEDRAWINLRDPSLTLTSLEAGKYQLEIEAANALGEWGGTARLHLEILPPLWKRGWVILLFSTSLTLTLVLLIRSYYQRARRATDFRIAFLEGQMQGLASQLNPHFLFNTMNSLSYYVSKNERLSSMRYIAKLAKLMRRIYENSQSSFVPLRDEMQAVEEYMDLEKMRFQFDYHTEVDPALLNCLVPPMLIQPFLENAIQHGFAPPIESRIFVKVRKIEGRLELSVHNTGEELHLTLDDLTRNKSSHSVALISKRFKLIKDYFGFDMDMTLTESDIPGFATAFTLNLPMIDEDDPNIYR